MSPPNLIIPNLYLGDVNNATNLHHPLIKELNLKHIINCCSGCPNYFPNDYKYINLDWIDNLYQNLNENNELLNTLEYIENALEKDEAVFVHCGAGISRSAILVIGFLIKKFRWDYKTSFKFVKEKRPNIKPNESFINQIINLLQPKSEIDF